jgi:hypothetical protein
MWSSKESLVGMGAFISCLLVMGTMTYRHLVKQKQFRDSQNPDSPSHAMDHHFYISRPVVNILDKLTQEERDELVIGVLTLQTELDIDSNRFDAQPVWIHTAVLTNPVHISPSKISYNRISRNSNNSKKNNPNQMIVNTRLLKLTFRVSDYLNWNWESIGCLVNILEERHSHTAHKLDNDISQEKLHFMMDDSDHGYGYHNILPGESLVLYRAKTSATRDDIINLISSEYVTLKHVQVLSTSKFITTEISFSEL